MEACCVKVDVIDSMFRNVVSRQLVEGVLYAWQMSTRTQIRTQQLLKVHRQATEAQAAQERMQAESSAAAERAHERVLAIGHGFAYLLSLQRERGALQETFCHWRCVAEGLVLPYLRKRTAVSPAGFEDQFRPKQGSAQRQSSRLRRKAWMWWVGQIREMVIRRMQVETWVSARQMDAALFAWRTWSDQCHAHKNVRHAEAIANIFVRRVKQVSLAVSRTDFLSKSSFLSSLFYTRISFPSRAASDS